MSKSIDDLLRLMRPCLDCGEPMNVPESFGSYCPPCKTKFFDRLMRKGARISLDGKYRSDPKKAR